MNKRMRYWYKMYQQSPYTELYEVYRSYSDKKARSFENIRREAVELNRISAVKILSWNCDKYTCAYEYPSPVTGEIRFRVHTADNTYDVPLDGSENLPDDYPNDTYWRYRK